MSVKSIVRKSATVRSVVVGLVLAVVVAACSPAGAEVVAGGSGGEEVAARPALADHDGYPEYDDRPWPRDDEPGPPEEPELPPEQAPGQEPEQGPDEPGQEREIQPEHTSNTENQQPGCAVEYLTDDLTGNRHNGLPLGRLQVVLYYDGLASSPELHIGLLDGPDLVVGGQSVGGEIQPFGRAIETREYALYNCELTGRFDVVGAEPNGVVDGVAFGVLWRNERGDYQMVKSSNPPGSPSAGANFVGMWPLGFSRASFEDRTPQITDNFGRESARAIIIGAALLPNGTYSFWS